MMVANAAALCKQLKTQDEMDYPAFKNKLPRSRADEVLLVKHFSFEAELRELTLRD